MRNHKRKGQGAMEYLMTYGWAIIVIALVVGALFALGILNPATYQQKRCSGLQYFTYEDQLLSATASEYTLDVLNGRDTVTISSIKVGSAAANSTPIISDASLQAGDRFRISTNTVPAGLTTGAAYPTNMVVIITYSATGGIAGQTDRATCTGIVQ